MMFQTLRRRAHKLSLLCDNFRIILDSGNMTNVVSQRLNFSSSIWKQNLNKTNYLYPCKWNVNKVDNISPHFFRNFKRRQGIFNSRVVYI